MDSGHDIDFSEEEVFGNCNAKREETRPPKLIIMPFYVEKFDFLIFVQVIKQNYVCGSFF